MIDVIAIQGERDRQLQQRKIMRHKLVNISYAFTAKYNALSFMGYKPRSYVPLQRRVICCRQCANKVLHCRCR